MLVPVLSPVSVAEAVAVAAAAMAEVKTVAVAVAQTGVEAMTVLYPRLLLRSNRRW